MTLTEPTLFDAPVTQPAARVSDPPTSKVQMDVRPYQGDVLRALRLRGVASTCEEIQQTLLDARLRRMERNEIGSRCAEMADPKRMPDGKPLLRRAGVKKNRRKRDVAAWALTNAGEHKARELDS